MSDWKRWAQRRVSRGPAAQPQAPQAPAPAAPAAQALPPPPPGYGYVFSPPHGYVLVPVSAPGPALTAPPVQPHAAPHQRVVASQPPETCTLVRPGNEDTYAQLLAQVPSITPRVIDDGKAGTESTPEYQSAMHSDTQAYPQQGKGALAPVFRAPELKN